MNGIILQAYSPLGNGGTSTGRDGGIVLEYPLVVAVARRHSVSDAQVALRWSIDQGVAVVTSTVRADYLAEDLAVLRFQLAPEEAGGRHLDLPANDKEELIDALAGLGDLLAAGVASRKEMFVTARTHGGPIGYEATMQWVTNLMLSSNSSLGGWIDLSSHLCPVPTWQGCMQGGFSQRPYCRARHMEGVRETS
ncbi:hypothetical protein CYMTET_41209 [Cymbomonas tetramitiformis]|uniref:NADP-dependent oxidoreductase domain-containing protein n=1 Tax=Cymbomonas tetramitiformis TaxID=36881 RepID=A0AAE0C7M2_9CHLO|nr:hypothetical protein CYMTET_41209 [Cymbomonas tetramitiformis]